MINEMPNVGWRWEIVRPSGQIIPWYPTVSGSLEFDTGRDVPRAVSGLVTTLREGQKILSLQDRFRLYLLSSTQGEYLMGTFYLSDNVINRNFYTDLGVTYNTINHLGLADPFLTLRRSTGEPETILAGSNPAIEMMRLLDGTNVRYSIGNSAYNINQDITWDGDETLLGKLQQLAELAGHLPPWANAEGLFRSEPVDFVEQEIFDIEDLGVVDGTLAFTQNFLAAPNRIIVTGTDPSLAYPLRGQWDAPSSYLYSEAGRGYILTESVDLQGLQSVEHANEIARLIGLRTAATTMSFECMPTEVFNDPRLVRAEDELWRVTGFQLSLEPNALMQINAIRYVEKQVL